MLNLYVFLFRIHDRQAVCTEAISNRLVLSFQYLVHKPSFVGTPHITSAELRLFAKLLEYWQMTSLILPRCLYKSYKNLIAQV